ncbi:GntR family transcriptional regulator [Xanthobacter sp. TB0136]|uniref:GntR family transcriptional regulator n=1 Tax=Xanthobacter sp. TB0136 TaxID=3459177 RepID=UPI004039D39D
MTTAMNLLDQSPILVDRVYEQLVFAITARRLEPGARILQAELADQLGVSRQPVSHALQLLKKQGLVQEAGRKGLEVTPLDPQHIRNLYQVRSALDALASRLAAGRIRAGEIAQAEKTALDKIVKAGLKLDLGAPPIDFVLADVEFHNAIYRLSGNASIVETLEPQMPHIMRAMHVVLQALDVRTLRNRVWAEHAAIADAVLSGDADRAAQAAFAHADVAGSETERHLRSA